MNKYIERIKALRSLFSQYNIDGIYLTKPEDVAYFTGHKGSDMQLWISHFEAVILTDFRYREVAQSFSWLDYFEISAHRKSLEILRSSKAVRIGICRNSLPLDTYLEFQEALCGKELIPTGDAEYSIVNDLRIIKDADEIEYTKIAEEIGSQAFSHILSFIQPGMSERHVQLEIEQYMLRNGADGLSFDTICISGAKTSMPHGIPDDKIIEVGDFVTMDYGCTYKGYHSDMTRTIAIGKATDEMKKVYEIVLRAQKNACEKIKAGLPGDVCHHFALDIIEEAGYGEFFGHGLGHGTGLEIHEAPRLSLSYQKPIPVHSIVSIEPGIYLPGKFGVRIEDLAVVKENGIINLTSAPKELIII